MHVKANSKKFVWKIELFEKQLGIYCAREHIEVLTEYLN